MRRPFALLLTVVCLAAPALAKQQLASKSAAAGGAAMKGFRAEFLADLDDVQSKIVALAQAIPAEKYAWRPAEGVRSISEVNMHIAGSNYFLATFLGVQPPAGISDDLEKITDKQKVIAELKKSFEHIRAIAKKTTDADLEKPVNLFGKPTTQRAVFSTMLNHLHEHLGQSIAYARTNGIVPPWSR